MSPNPPNPFLNLFFKPKKQIDLHFGLFSCFSTPNFLIMKMLKKTPKHINQQEKNKKKLFCAKLSEEGQFS